jgi:hypothetical protein
MLGQLNNSALFGYQFKLNGKVKELTVTNYWAETVEGKVVKGRPVSIEDRKTTPVSRDYMERYNEIGVIESIVAYADNGKKDVDIRTTITGKKIEKYESFQSDTLRSYMKVFYEGDRIIRFERYLPGNDTLQIKVNMFYDPNGNILKFERYDKKGSIVNTGTFERDANGRVLKYRLSDKDGKDISVHEYTYDKNGYWLTGHEVFTNPAITLNSTYTFESDKMGNWTRMVINNDGKPFLIREREIRYY